MFELFIKVIDRFIDLLREREKHLGQRFEKIIQPAFSDLQKVHCDYLAMFLKTKQILECGEPNDEAKTHSAAREACQYLIDNRISLRAVRQKLSALEDLLVDRSVSKYLTSEERRLLKAIVSYTKVEEWFGLDATCTAGEGLIGLLNRSTGYDSDLSGRKLTRMKITKAEVNGGQMSSPQIATYIDELINGLETKWVMASKAYNALSIVVASGTS